MCQQGVLKLGFGVKSMDAPKLVTMGVWRVSRQEGWQGFLPSSRFLVMAEKLGWRRGSLEG